MPLKAQYCKHTLNFRFEARTSRGLLPTHTSFIIKLLHTSSPTLLGLGEAAPLKGLSIDYRPDFEKVIRQIVSEINTNCFEISELEDFLLHENFDKQPAIRFAFETALLDLKQGDNQRTIFQNKFAAGQADIEINGLIWMGDEDFMLRQLEDKLLQGYKTIKIKIGALSFDTEYQLLKSIRSRFSANELTLRVDANGAFAAETALEVLDRLTDLELHSIEQPIAAKQWEEMARLCEKSPIPIALDEELIGIEKSNRIAMLKAIKPQFLVLKPTLLGGFGETDHLIELAESQNISWWITSALESNIGLNAICQYTFEKQSKLPQGLGTGLLYSNNIDSPLSIEEGRIKLLKGNEWDYSSLKFGI